MTFSRCCCCILESFVSFLMLDVHNRLTECLFPTLSLNTLAKKGRNGSGQPHVARFFLNYFFFNQLQKNKTVQQFYLSSHQTSSSPSQRDSPSRTCLQTANHEHIQPKLLHYFNSVHCLVLSTQHIVNQSLKTLLVKHFISMKCN